ncbi:MAG: ABC transporter ATP-binding protein [Endozoicomonadaceae bacterium]|nr:ABC transporter ATP-binding protein [Endozoicomonadaceae bacterium]
MAHMLTVNNLNKTYSNGIKALKGIDLTVKEGDFFALLGPNGAGKSTTIGIISSLVNKTSGKVTINGFDLDNNVYEAKRQIGIVPQEFNFNPFETVLDILMNQAGYYGVVMRQRRLLCEKYLKALGLWEKRNGIAKDLSGGMKRRMMIIRALVHQPPLLILDEPTAGVDTELRYFLWDFLRTMNREGTTIILTTHYLEEAEKMCRNIAIIDHGKIIQNTSMQNLLQQHNTERFFIDIQEKTETIPTLPGYKVSYAGSHSFEVKVSKGQSLNELFLHLEKQKLHVTGLRSEGNRLEELFLDMTAKH